MPILFNESVKEFHLYNDHISYIFNIMENNQLGHLYFGKKIKHRSSFEHLFQLEPRPITACVFEGNLEFSLDHIKQEYPSYGTSDFRYPAHVIRQENGSRITNFEYKSYEIYKGKKKLKGLPATYVEKENEATTLEVTLQDEIIGTELVLTYTIYEDMPVITRNARFVHHGKEKIVLENAMSMSMEFPDDDFEMVHLCGAWARERHVKTRKLEKGIQSIYSARGASSANHNPFIALKRSSAGENQGEVYGYNFVYSGNFLAQVEVDSHNLTRVMMGINPFEFEWELNKDEEFQTPEVVMVYSDKGLNCMSQTYHKLYRTRLVKGQWRDKERPVLINNWEGTYFDFTEEKILDIAETGKELGIELFVLDDGWFGKRNDDTTSLGDWFVNKEKLPEGITGVAKKIEAMGMKFGLWFEPEMVNKESELYKNHPDWMISTPKRRDSHGRNQYVLDFSRKEVVDYIYDMMYKVLKEAPISYIKWDMNRNITEAFSQKLSAERQGELMHRYILGVYDLYERLTSGFPHILFESCASGGGRFDAGIMQYAPQAWGSDDSDAIERLKIQYGTSMAYPISSIGAHVSAAPNHQIGRMTPIETRANVAYFGTFGYELDLNKLTEEEKEKVRKQVKFFKDHRELLHKGTFYRLISPFEGDGNVTSWMVVSEDKKKAIVGYYQALNKPNPSFTRLKLTGLDPEKEYNLNNIRYHYGDELMNVGIPLDGNFKEFNIGDSKIEIGDFYSQMFILTEK